VLPPGDRRRAKAIMLLSGERRRVLLLGRMPQGQVLLPGNRRKAEVINVLLPGTKTEGVLLLKERCTGRML